MKTFISTLVVALSLAVAACERAESPVSPTMAAPSNTAAPAITQSAAAAKASTFTFTKIPAAWASHNVAPGPGLEVMLFEMDSSTTRSTTLRRVAFQLSGTARTGDLTNFQIVYFPDGAKKPGTVIGTNDGSTWTPGPNFIVIDLTPVALGQNFKGVFALHVDPNRSGFTFSPQLQTATITVGGVDQVLLDQTCDLPLPGDTFNVM